MAGRRAAGSRLAWQCRARRGEGRAEVRLEVLDVLEPDRDAQQAGRDARLEQLRLGELALRGRRRMDDHRVDAAQGRGELRQAEVVDDRPAGLAAAGDLEGEHPAGRPRPELALRRPHAGDGSGDRGRGRCARRPDARARPPVPRRSGCAARRGPRGSGCRAGRGTPRAGRASRRSRSGPARPRRSAPSARRRRRRSGRCGRRGTWSPIRRRGRRRARAAGRRTGSRTCCRRCRWRRAGGRARRAPRDR